MRSVLIEANWWLGRFRILAVLSLSLFCVDIEASNEEAESEVKKKAFLDHFHDGFANSVDGSARWVDGFFGKRRTDDETPGAYGRLRVRTYWKEYEGMKVKTRFRAELPLTNISSRVNAIFGRGDTDSVTQGTDQYDYLLSSGGEDSWLAGLGYTPPWSRSERFSVSAGVKIDFPMNPYVRVAYRLKHNFDDKSLIRLRQSVFWENQDGFGTSSSIGLERKISDSVLVRWANWAKFDEVTHGVAFDSRIEFYQRLDEKRALLYTIGMEGETDNDAPVREYGVYMIYRQQALREWFFGELILGVTRPHFEDWSERRTGIMLGLGFEMVFQHSSNKRGPGSESYSFAGKANKWNSLR